MGRVKNNFFDVLDKYEYWKSKCEKSLLGEFSFGVSICRNKGTQSDLGALFLSGAPDRGVREALPPAPGAIVPPKTYESNFIRHGFVQFGKQLWRYKLIVLSQQCCVVWFISPTVGNL